MSRALPIGIRGAATPLLWSLVLAFAAWVYLPGIDGPPMLDDRASLEVLSALEGDPALALDYIFGDISGPLGRPVSMLSFVLEKLYLDGGVEGGKQLNIALHLVAGSLVFWLCILLLGHIGVPAHRALAGLVAAAWLLSPLHVSAVLYVVQRMAILATIFSLSAVISYVYWRLSVLRGQPRSVRLIPIAVFMLLAIYSKETAIVTLPILLLMEVLWFGFEGPGGLTLPWLRRATLGLVLVGAVFLVVFFSLAFDWLVGSFSHRTFTLVERVLTETRILWEYVGQLYSPTVYTMGLFHDDVVVSTALNQPSTTLPAAMAWFGLIALCGLLLRWEYGRYAVFAMLFFLVGHSTESTILPLELYFEHRNYLPGIGLFLLLAVVYALAVRTWPELKMPLLAYLAFYVLWLAVQTGSQVQVWSNGSLLRLHDVNAHPSSFRANADMASEMAQLGQLQAALDYSGAAHAVNAEERAGDYDIRDLALSCMARKALPISRIASIGTVQSERPLSSVATLNVLVRLLQDNACPNFDRVLFADRMKTIFLDDMRDGQAAAHIYSRLAALENALGRYDNAYRYSDAALALSPGDISAWLMKLHFATALERWQEVDELKSKLQSMDEEGKLTTGQRQTLSLYLEN